MNFKQYIRLLEQNTVGTHNDFANAIFLPSNWTGSETAPNILPFLPSTDLEIPNLVKNSIISNIVLNKNPILIELKDGTKLYLNLDQYNRISKKPEVGKQVSVTFQRSSTDFSSIPSKIVKIDII